MFRSLMSCLVKNIIMLKVLFVFVFISLISCKSYQKIGGENSNYPASASVSLVPKKQKKHKKLSCFF